MKNKPLYDICLHEINDWLADVGLTVKDWQKIIDPTYFVERRDLTGGPNPEVVKDIIQRRK